MEVLRASENLGSWLCFPQLTRKLQIREALVLHRWVSKATERLVAVPQVPEEAVVVLIAVFKPHALPASRFCRKKGSVCPNGASRPRIRSRSFLPRPCTAGRARFAPGHRSQSLTRRKGRPLVESATRRGVLSNHEDFRRNQTRVFVDYLEALQVPRKGSAAIQAFLDVVEGAHVLVQNTLRGL